MFYCCVYLRDSESGVVSLGDFEGEVLVSSGKVFVRLSEIVLNMKGNREFF